MYNPPTLWTNLVPLADVQGRCNGRYLANMNIQHTGDNCV